jgi:hypothetical protein
MGGLGGDRLTTVVSGELDVADIYSAVAVLAAVCNANPMILLKYPPGTTFRSLGIEVESHNASHRIGNAGMSGTCVAGVIDMLLKIDGYYATKFAKMVGMLDSIQEGEGTVLDNTAAVWMNEMSDGNAHNLNNTPIVQAGSMGGYFKTGWAVNVENGESTMSPGRSEDLCVDGKPTQVNGTTQSTGTEATIANAPINKYFCNLMNGLGVKADATGHPAMGGTQEVTHYGMYDRTEDFIGGGTKPAMISNPGEWSELKAGA